MNGRETCRLEDGIAVQLDGREGVRWVSVFLSILADAGIRSADVQQAQRDLARAQRAIDTALAALRVERAALPRGRKG